MSKASPSRDLCQRVERFFSGGRCFAVAKGRVGLYAGLLAMDLPAGSKVVMPGYSCVVVPSAIKYAGLTPQYVDIDPNTYNVDPQLLARAYSNEASAVIVQHTYGIPCEMNAIRKWADEKSLPIIEDCCHTFGNTFAGELCGTFSKFAFMSGQWNKPFSTGLGGMLLVNDLPLADKIERLLAEKAAPSGTLRNLLLRCQILVFEAIVSPRTAGKITKLYRFLNKFGLVIGSSSEGELLGEMPENYLRTMAPCQARKGLRELARIEQNIEHRRDLAAFYHERLPDTRFNRLADELVADQPLLRYPVRIANKLEVVELAERRGFEIGTWFESPLHPEGTRLEEFGYTQGMCPEAEKACREVVNLPTHFKVDKKTAERTLAFLEEVGKPV